MSSTGILDATDPNAVNNVSLFSEEKLTSLLKWKEIESKLGERNLLARPLRLGDYEAGYLELLSQLTQVGNVTKSQFVERFDRMKRSNQIEDHYVIVVIEDKATKKIVGTSTLFLELKFIHECATRARLEDVAILDSYRGKQIGEIIVSIIVELASEAYKCYKLSLDCEDGLVKFYAKNNFAHASNMLCIRFE